VQFNPAEHDSPTHNVEVLVHKATRPHVELALIEAWGGSEADLLNEARERAKALGADAIGQLETQRIYNEPMPVYDPWYDPVLRLLSLQAISTVPLSVEPLSPGGRRIYLSPT
jgi:hypothetical protein